MQLAPLPTSPFGALGTGRKESAHAPLLLSPCWDLPAGR